LPFESFFRQIALGDVFNNFKKSLYRAIRIKEREGVNQYRKTATISPNPFGLCNGTVVFQAESST